VAARIELALVELAALVTIEKCPDEGRGLQKTVIKTPSTPKLHQVTLDSG